MSEESKFLKFQDVNGDGLNDKCDDIIDVVPAKKCPACVPNPNYIAPNWRNLDSTDPWFNEKYCKYQVTVQTSVSSIEGEDIEDIYRYHKEMAVEGLLLAFNKSNTEKTQEMVSDGLVGQSYDLDARPNSYLKLLYSIPYDIFANIENDENDEDDEEEDDDDGQAIVVEMNADKIKEKLIRVRKTFNLYGRFYRVMTAVEGGKLIFTEKNTLFSVAQFDRYGDPGIFPKSRLAQLLTTLNGFLNNHQLNIFGVGKISFGRDRVTKIEFKFTAKYKLKKLRVWTLGCGGKPYVFRKKKLKRLNARDAWKDRTAVAYFAKLDAIDSKINGREAPQWLDVVTEFTYPPIYQTFNWPLKEASGPETALSCMGDALAENVAELGQDIMDEVLSLGDALAFQFNKDLCANSIGEFQEKKFKFGTIMDPNAIDPATGNMGQPKNLTAFAMEQAFKELEDDDQVFAGVCANMLSSFAGGTGLLPSSVESFLDSFYADGLDRIKLCGLFDLLMDSINCLLGGLSFEEALASIIKAALKGMSMDNLGDFFIGLPPEKQGELERLVEKKINEGDVFKDPSGAALAGGLGTTSDVISGKLKYTAPWKRKKNNTAAKPEGDPDTMTKDQPPPTVPAYEAGNATSQPTRRTLAQQFDVKSNAENELSDAVVVEAYIKALVEVYSDDLLSVVDILNKYPGAQMIAKIIATMDCPRPPILQPNMLDFLKDLELPWCRSVDGLKLPKLFNPFGWIPKLSDLTYFLWYVLKLAIQKILLNILIKILIKVCELIGDAICKALEVVGDLAASLPAVIGGKTTFREVIRDSICGESASDEEIDATITEMFEKLGVGGAALSDQDAVLGFVNDISAATTRSEMMQAFLGTPPDSFKTAAYNIMQYEYPQFEEAFSTKDSIGDFVANCGTLIPEDIKQGMRDFLSDLPPDDALPANPTLCATPEQLEDFQNLRCQLLEGRATPEQCRQMFDNLQGDLAEDLEGIATMVQRGGPFGNIGDIMPPIVSQPGCDDGLVPFESEEQQASAGLALKGELTALKKDYAEDMLGNGPGNGGVFGSWGLLNMVLSDTMGQPLTAHWRKASLNPRYVDFVTDTSEDAPGDDENFLFFFSDPSKTELQKGNFPDKVAPWLQEQVADLNPSVKLSNRWMQSETIEKSYRDLGFQNLFGNIDISRISIPDMGYNVDLKTTEGSEIMEIVREGRKGIYDLRLEFTDNNKGRVETESTDYAYGFYIDSYFYDLDDISGLGVSNTGTSAAPLDTTRVDILNLYNPSVATRADLKQMMTKEEWKEYKKTLKKSAPILEDRLFEFLSVDNTYADMDTSKYPRFTQCFNIKTEYPPSMYLLSDIITHHPQPSGAPALEDIESHLNGAMSEMFNNIANQIAMNTQAFKYGAKYDSLVEEDAEYLVKDDQTLSPEGTLYAEAEIEDEDGNTRRIKNSDMILGVSRDQLINGDDARVYYLDPTTYGGSYTNPGVYIKPIQYEGYLGMVNVMFPEFSPCKPRNTDLVDFNSIADEISATYNEIPEDQRLQSDPDCITEAPYNRILTRTGKAGIQGLIRAACRIYASSHYLKSYATFSVFRPDFENLFSSIYPQYIVENMEKSFKDAQAAGWEFFNTFKDDEFWYAFLEQAVQTYGRLVDSGAIVNPPETVLQALFRINDAQEEYNYPQITESRNDVKKAKAINETTAPHRWPNKSRGLKQYRDEKNFEFIQATEEDAKIILKEFVIQELNFVGTKFVANMASNGIEPKINDIVYYILSNMTQGGETLDLDKQIVEQPIGLPTTGSEHYTAGGEFSLPDGEEYIGYFHVHPDEDDNPIYMVGEFHTDNAHDEIAPFSNKVKVPIGDVNEYQGGNIYSDSPELPFVIEKYISIDGFKYNPSTAINIIKANDISLNISDVYPGSMELVYPLRDSSDRATNTKTPTTGSLTATPTVGIPQISVNNNQVGSNIINTGSVDSFSPLYENTAEPPVGIKGELGIRYGLQFSAMIAGKKYILVETEMDMLDLKIGQAPPFEGDSKLLLCLINQLKSQEEMNYIINGVYGFKKALSIMAIYNDMGFLPSIGELTVQDGDTKPMLFTLGEDPTFDSKPGMKVTFPQAPENWAADYSESNAKWASYDDRQIFTPFNLDWDDWDQVLLKNSKSRIKKLFKRHYYKRKFDPANDDESTDFAALFVKNLMASMKPATGKRILPWFRRRNLRDNPFNSNGDLCKKPEN